MAPAEDVGRAHWLRQNQAWRGAEASRSAGCAATCFPRQPRRLSAKQYDVVFQRLVVDRERLRRPLPLTDVFPMLVSGWKKTGVWPANPGALEPSAGDPGAIDVVAARQQQQEQWIERSKLGGRNFVDRMRCTVAGGSGGNGCVSFLRDAHVARGPANGGNGGAGGDVWFEVDENETSLSCVKQRLRAQPGTNGKGKSMHGPRGGDLIVRVPKGTVVRQVVAATEPAAATRGTGSGGNGSGDSMGFLDALEEQLGRDARAREHDKAALF
ncbi:GTPase of the mitochondrial inner membrane that associates with the large ribosomal subunit, partial [Coemansia spiralis]